MTADELRALDRAACQAVGIEPVYWKVADPAGNAAPGWGWFLTKRAAEKAIGELEPATGRLIVVAEWPAVTTNAFASDRLLDALEAKDVHIVVVPQIDDDGRIYMALEVEMATLWHQRGEGDLCVHPRAYVGETRLIALAKAAVAWKEES